MEYLKINNDTIKTAVKEWLEDDKKAASKYGHISNWDVSNVTDMSFMFKGSSFNQDLSSWDVSNVADFKHFDSDTLLSETNKPNFIQ